MVTTKPFQKSRINKINTKVLDGNISVVFYDMTTLYFEASDEDDLRPKYFNTLSAMGIPSVLQKHNMYQITYTLPDSRQTKTI
jgi:hypothetical protein